MLTLRCFGSVSILTAEGELTLRSRKHSGLLLYLCAHPKSVHARADLARLLWNDSGARARHSLSQALYDIKSKVGSILDANTISLRLRADLIEYEAGEFEKAVERGDHQAALDRYRGEFAPTLSNLNAGTFDRWLEGERDRYRALAGIALRSLLRESEATADWDGVCHSALRLIQMSDFDERAHRALMRGLWLKGDGLSALEHFKGLSGRRSAEPRGDLAPETIDLAARIHDDEVGRSSHTSSELIGRSTEFAAMREAYDSARAGRAAAVIVAGEQGSGKTRLLAEFARYIEGCGARAVRSVATALAGDRPYRSSLDLMAAAGIGIKDERPDASTGYSPAHSLEVKRGFEDGLREVCQKRPVALLLDDAEHIDGESAELLASSRTRLARMPVLLVIALDSASPPDTPIRALEASLRRGERVRILHLQPLGADQMRRILERSVTPVEKPVLARAISLAGGNPLYAKELVRCFERGRGHQRAGEAKVPFKAEPYLESVKAQRLRALIGERVGALLEPERSVVNHLAVLADAVDEGLLQEIVEVADVHDSLLALERKGLVEPAKDRWRLRHGVVRDVITRELGYTRRAAIHLAAATVLSRRKDVDPLLLAEHYAHGGERETAYGYAMRAAETAVAGAPVTAAAAATLAAAQGVTVQDRRQARFLEGLAELEQGRYARAESIMLSLVGASNAPASVFPAISAVLAEAKFNLCEFEAAEHELRSSKSGLKNLSHESLDASIMLRVASLELRLAHAKANRPRMRSAARDLDHLLHGSKLESSVDQLAWFTGWVELLKYSLWCESLTAANDVLAAHARTLSHLDRQLRVKALSAKAIVATRQGRLQEGIAIYSDLVGDSHHHPSHLRASLLNNLAVVKLEQGAFGDAARLLDECIRVDQHTSAVAPHAVFALMNRGACAMYRGTSAEAELYYRQAARLCKSVDLRGLHDETSACLGLLALESGSLRLGKSYSEALELRPAYHRWEEERFKAAWLRGFLLARNRPDEASEYLLHASEVEAHFDVPSYHKLRFLARLARTRHEQATNRRAVLSKDPARRELVHLGLGWFARTAMTWWDRAEAASSDSVC